MRAPIPKGADADGMPAAGAADAAASAVVVVLGAGRPFRGSAPAGLHKAPDERRVLDWIVDAFSEVPPTFHFVGGYHLEDVAARYPTFSYSFNPDWESTGSLWSFSLAPLNPRRVHYVCYSDIVFPRSVVRRLAQAEGDVVIAVDRGWRHRYAGRSQRDMEIAEKVALRGDVLDRIDPEIPVDRADAEYVGVAKLSPSAVAACLDLFRSKAQALRHRIFCSLFTSLMEAGFRVRTVDIGTDWAELNAPQDLARLVLGTKAETLDRLRPVVRDGVIGKQVAFTLAEWRDASGGVLARVAGEFAGAPLIVRSSTLGEDTWTTANAGAFVSVPDVPADDRKVLRAAVERVIGSIPDDDPRHQVFVQEMVKDVALSGVVFTRTLSHGGPYYTVNYDDTSASTHGVTSGLSQDAKTLVVHRTVARLPSRFDARLGRLLKAVREIESLTGHDCLDIEFAVTGAGEVHVLQVRPIVVDHRRWRGSDELVEALLSEAEREFRARSPAPPFLVGKSTVYGVMPDWNPAEMIGTKPGRLAYSLYRYLITDEVWAAQRAEFGYRDVRPQPLMIALAGHPYIDVRTSLNSFIPAPLAPELAGRLVEHYLDRLKAHPDHHDKLEFEIAFTALPFDFAAKAARLREAGFNRSEIETLAEALRRITALAFDRYPRDVAQLQLLARRCRDIVAGDYAPLPRAAALLADCRRLGTPAFAHLARGAFVAMTLLTSAVSTGAIGQGQLDSFLASLHTVARRFREDAARVASGELDRGAFIAEYGHLRPGTYDIAQPSYAQAADAYLRSILDRRREPTPKRARPWSWSREARRRISACLRESGLPGDFDRFDAFVRHTIEGRENAKFEFSRNLSAALDVIAQFGADHGVAPAALAQVSWDEISNLQGGQTPADVSEWLRLRAKEGEDWHHVVQCVEMPPLVTAEEDLRIFLHPPSKPNYVGSGNVTAPLVGIEGRSIPADGLAGKIVIVPQADPGYDWLFGHGIAGLITAYGGANSHMAIRAAELGLPAAIGVGEKLYRLLREAAVVCLDCQHRRIEVVQ